MSEWQQACPSCSSVLSLKVQLGGKGECKGAPTSASLHAHPRGFPKTMEDERVDVKRGLPYRIVIKGLSPNSCKITSTKYSYAKQYKAISLQCQAEDMATGM